jgi:hypothetical protein
MPKPPRITSAMDAELSGPSYRHIAQRDYHPTQWQQDPEWRLLVHSDGCVRWRGLACGCDVTILHVAPRTPGG